MTLSLTPMYDAAANQDSQRRALAEAHTAERAEESVSVSTMKLACCATGHQHRQKDRPTRSTTTREVLAVPDRASRRGMCE
jgi:hypothetical protein